MNRIGNKEVSRDELAEQTSSVIVGLPVVWVQVQGHAKVVEGCLEVLQVQVALAAVEARLSLVGRVVLDELGEVHNGVMPIS